MHRVNGEFALTWHKARKAITRRCARWFVCFVGVLAIPLHGVVGQGLPSPPAVTVPASTKPEELPPAVTADEPEAISAPRPAANPPLTERLPLPTMLEPEQVYSVDLCLVLRLADSRNPTIALARQAIQENLALQQAANVLLLPTLRGGGNYHNHTGNLQRSGGSILSVDQQSLYYGGGAGAVTASTVTMPAIQIYSHLGDAYFEPLAARQRTAASQFEARATANTQLLEVATLYLNLVAAEAQFEIYLNSADDMEDVARVTAAFAEIGQGRKADADRAITELRLLQSQQFSAQERMIVASARLAGALNLDPSTRLQTLGGPIPVVELVNKSYSLPLLEDIALRNRPEVSARSLDLAVQQTRVQQEKTRPLLPTVSVAFSGGVFGGGSDLTMPFFGRFNGRSDFDVMALWTAQNLGVGNLAITRNRRAQADGAWAQRLRTLNLIRSQVADGYAQTQARRRQLEIAARRMQTSEVGYREDLVRIRGGQGLPIEILDSLQRLVAARQSLVDVVIGYDEAQFRLFTALGQPPTVALPCAQALCQPQPSIQN
jgi:outer membrane protein TolC